MSVSNKNLLKWLLISLFVFVCMGVFHMSAATIYAEENNEQPSQVEVQQDSEAIPNDVDERGKESTNQTLDPEKNIATMANNASEAPVVNAPVKDITELYLNGQTGDDANDGTSVDRA